MSLDFPRRALIRETLVYLPLAAYAWAGFWNTVLSWERVKASSEINQNQGSLKTIGNQFIKKMKEKLQPLHGYPDKCLPNILTVQHP